MLSEYRRGYRNNKLLGTNLCPAFYHFRNANPASAKSFYASSKDDILIWTPLPLLYRRIKSFSPSGLTLNARSVRNTLCNSIPWDRLETSLAIRDVGEFVHGVFQHCIFVMSPATLMDVRAAFRKVS